MVTVERQIICTYEAREKPESWDCSTGSYLNPVRRFSLTKVPPTLARVPSVRGLGIKPDSAAPIKSCQLLPWQKEHRGPASTQWGLAKVLLGQEN